MGKVIRRAVAVLLCATAVILAVLPAKGAEATSVHGDYEYDGATVAKYLGTDTEVTLPAWVNRVGKEAFENYDNMTKLVLTDTVTTVDFGAFSNCDNLATVKMGESVRTLGSAAFSGCSSLYSVSVPASVRTIGSGVFAGCPSLASVPVSPANRHYTSYDGVIYSNDGKKLVQYLAGRPSTTYRMPTSVREIEEYAFWGANNLSKLSISYGVDKIPEYAFSNCRGLQHVTLPRSVQSIFAYAFENCDSLSYINIPDSVGYIDDRAFSNTQGAKLRFVDKNGNVIKTFNSEDVDKYGSGTDGAPMVTPPAYKTGDFDTSDIENEPVTPATTNPTEGPDTAVTENGNNSATADNTTDSGTTDNSGTSNNTTDNTDNNGTTENNGDNGTSDNTGNNSTTDNTGNSGTTNSTDDSNTTDSGNNTDQNDYDDLSDYEPYDPSETNFNPEDVTPLEPGDEEEPGEGTVPDQGQTPAPSNILTNNDQYNDGYYKASDSGSEPWNTKIEYHDYEDNMTPYDLGAGKILGGTAVLRMSSHIPVKGFNFPNAEYEDTMMNTAGTYGQNDSDVIGDVFASYSGTDENVKVPAGVEKIGDRAFYKNDTVQSVDLPKSLSDIGEFAFARSNISSIELPEGTKSIDYAAFYKCPNLSSVLIPESVDSIALGAFDQTPFLEGWKNSDDGNDFLVVGDGILLGYKGKEKKLILPDGIKHIAPGAFSHNSNLESIIIPPSVNDIGEEAFCDCSNLHELVLQNGLTQIDDRAFKNSSIEALSIPDSVTGIGLGAFDNGGKLKTVIINGDDVPNVTYNKSATRLSAKDLRTRAFEGCDNAIVSNTCDIDSGTLFSPKFYGFDGEVYSIASNENKTLVLERAMKQPDEAGNVVIDQMVDIAGDTYALENVKSNAFDNYKNWEDWTDNKPLSVSVNGEQGDTLKDLLAEVNSNVLSQAETEDVNDTESGAPEAVKSNITVSVDGKRFPTRGDAHASIPGETDKYILNVTEDDSVNDKVKSAFLHDKGLLPDDYVPLSIDLYDKSGTVPIHKLGDSKLEVSMPVPSGMENDESIGIASLDDSGRLSQLSSNITDSAGGKNIDFVTGHCSTFVIYSRAPRQTEYSGGDVIESVDGEDAAGPGFAMNGTWQTLNKKVYGPLSVKWYIIVILFALSGILFLYDMSGKKKKRS